MATSKRQTPRPAMAAAAKQTPRPAVAAPPPPLVVIPPRPTAELPGGTPAPGRRPNRKQPSSPRSKPNARDQRGTATRAEIRRETPRRTAPRDPTKGNRGQAGRKGKA
jgi:hypothetical protein